MLYCKLVLTQGHPKKNSFFQIFQMTCSFDKFSYIYIYTQKRLRLLHMYDLCIVYNSFKNFYTPQLQQITFGQWPPGIRKFGCPVDWFETIMKHFSSMHVPPKLLGNSQQVWLFQTSLHDVTCTAMFDTPVRAKLQLSNPHLVHRLKGRELGLHFPWWFGPKMNPSPIDPSPLPCRCLSPKMRCMDQSQLYIYIYIFAHQAKAKGL